MFTVAIRLSDDKAPKGKLADADIVFNNQTDLLGLTLCGFSVWEGRQPGTKNVSYPSRSWSSNGERRTFALLRETDQVEGPKAKKWLTDLIIASYDEALHHAGNRPPAPAPATAANPAPAPAHAPAPPARARR